MQHVSNAMGIAALFLPGLWLGLLLSARHLGWAVPIALAAGAMACWVGFHKDTVDALMLLVYVPILLPFVVGVAISALGSGLAGGFLIRTYVPTLVAKAATALGITGLAVAGVVYLV